MLSIVHASELQFRHDAAGRDRELALLAAIREHNAARILPSGFVHAPAIRPAELARTRRAAWPRPIGAHGNAATAAAC